MGNTYKISAESIIRNKLVVTLDNERPLGLYKTNELKIDDKKYTYSLTHNDYMIIIDTHDSLLGKEIEFV